MVDKIKLTVNLDLARERGLSRDDIVSIQKLQDNRVNIIKNMLNTKRDNEVLLLDLLRKYRRNEIQLKRLWRFDINEDKFNKEYELPHCSCPILDNDELYGYMEDRYTNTECIYHGVENVHK